MKIAIELDQYEFQEILLDIEMCLKPWEYCPVCGNPLMFHWRGRSCLQPGKNEPIIQKQ